MQLINERIYPEQDGYHGEAVYEIDHYEFLVTYTVDEAIGNIFSAIETAVAQQGYTLLRTEVYYESGTIYHLFDVHYYFIPVQQMSLPVRRRVRRPSRRPGLMGNVDIVGQENELGNETEQQIMQPRRRIVRRPITRPRVMGVIIGEGGEYGLGEIQQLPLPAIPVLYYVVTFILGIIAAFILIRSLNLSVNGVLYEPKGNGGGGIPSWSPLSWGIILFGSAAVLTAFSKAKRSL